MTRYNLTRRTFALCGASVVAALSGQPTAQADGDPQTLAEAGRAVGIDIGTAMRANTPPSLAALIDRECNLVTPENALKPAALSPRQGEYRWSEADRIYAFAQNRGMKFHGHTLYWYKRPLSWGDDGDQSLGAVAARYGEYVAAVTGHYAKAVSWDVCNEIAGTSTLLRHSFPVTRYGLDFIERLLHAAHQNAPKAKLAINENDLECGDGDCAAKRDNVLKIFDDLKRRGAPLHALGIQSHLGSHRTPSPKATLQFIRDVASLGVEVYLSELDVNDSDLAADNRRRDEEVAAMYRDYLDTVLQSKAVKRIVFWGLTDGANWIAEGGARQRRDGAPQRPSLFDRALDRKPAYFQVLEALKGAAAR